MARRAVRLGIQPPRPLRLARTEAGRRAQLARLRTLSRWLAARTERVRPQERPLSERLRHYDALACIAGHESGGRWDISTGNGYYGGLQMDVAFQRTYAPDLLRRKGTADNWTMEEQMRTAQRAIRTRGFTPWPNTARMCGLL
ncbi:transglycosylase family protein [Miltoncostaea marina]|uniref:transglycosylase family protein n=1 Tax=Miltoncostaea marina TaxID=2843215 RepID=UPI001C3E77B8|nr:transglycosylase family protein [Miltoncostaea marina]